MSNLLLEVKDLSTFFHIDKRVVPAVENVSFQINKKETVGIVGESGSGKSVTALSIMRLITSPPGKIENGEIFFNGEDLLKLSEHKMRAIRGNRISMIFQEPTTSLNPVYTIGNQLSEAIMLHQGLSKQKAMEKAALMLERVKIPLPKKRLRQYPFQLSGGMRQRIMIAMALSCEPELLIADEPTTALDVTIQAQILYLIKELKEKTNTAVLLITHNLGVVAEIADTVIVMYNGRILEQADVRTLFKNPKHPYTIGLLKSIPKMEGQKKLYTIKGAVVVPGQIKEGCKFKTRCEDVFGKCLLEEPPLFEVGESKVRCWKYV